MGYAFKTQKSITITNAFQKIFNESGHKPNKNWYIKVANFKIV